MYLLGGLVQLPGNVHHQGGAVLHVGHSSHQDNKHKRPFSVNNSSIMMQLGQCLQGNCKSVRRSCVVQPFLKRFVVLDSAQHVHSVRVQRVDGGTNIFD